MFPVLPAQSDCVSHLRLGDTEAEGTLQVAAAGGGGGGGGRARGKGGGESVTRVVVSSILLTPGIEHPYGSICRSFPIAVMVPNACMPACMESILCYNLQASISHLPTHARENSKDSVPSASPFPIAMVTTICF